MNRCFALLMSLLFTATLFADSADIPEPTTMLLLGLGSVALLRRKK